MIEVLVSARQECLEGIKVLDRLMFWSFFADVLVLMFCSSMMIMIKTAKIRIKKRKMISQISKNGQNISRSRTSMPSRNYCRPETAAVIVD
jgi:hypothetical protein